MPPTPTATIRRKIAIGMTLTVLLDTVVQLLWKFSVATLPANIEIGQMVLAALHQPWFLALVVVASVQFANWIILLERAELSYAKPVAALSYVTVSLGSAWLFSEHVGPLKAVGIACVLAGVWLLCKSGSGARQAE
jgi:drug/metabolite transporter (DMT)-like permease